MLVLPIVELRWNQIFCKGVKLRIYSSPFLALPWWIQLNPRQWNNLLPSLNYSLNSWKHRICSKRLTSDILKIQVGVMCNFISKLVYCNFLSSDTCRDMGNILPLFFMCLKVPEMNISSTELKKLEFEHIRFFFFFAYYLLCAVWFSYE